MIHQPISIDNLRDLIHKKEAADPLVFLESVMNGGDPRRLSDIYELIMEIDSFSGDGIGKSEWAEIVDHVISKNKYYNVSISESTAAAKTLAEYLHPKRKQIEIKGSGVGNVNLEENPLTEEEIELFKEKFNDDF